MRKLLLLVSCTVLHASLVGAQSLKDTLLKVPNTYFNSISSKLSSVNKKVSKSSKKLLKGFIKSEAKLRKTIARFDTSLSVKLITTGNNAFEKVNSSLINPSNFNQYIPHFDSIATSLHFLQANEELISSTVQAQVHLNAALDQANKLKSSLQRAEIIRKFLKARQQFLKEQLGKTGVAKHLKKINKKVYYYSQQINEYKSILNDPRKIEKKVLNLLSKQKFFRDFMRKNSLLARLFRMPSDPLDPNTIASFAGLQTRVQVNNLIQQQISAGGPNAGQVVQQNIQAAQSRLNELKNRWLNTGHQSNDTELPDFKPNNQKTKGFLKRLEYGVNIQSQKSTSYFPITSDIGFSVGYKLNDKSIIGIGGSYKMGLGRGWNNINLTHEGISLRSFIDWKLKHSIFISGGYEQNYKSRITDLAQLNNYSSWQYSGLLGLSKTISTNTKLFKKTKLMVFWDFLSYQQIPKTDPFIFRISYSIR